MYAADHIIDMGPGAGVNGGYIAQGTLKDILETPNPSPSSIQRCKFIRTSPKAHSQRKVLEVVGAKENNLKISTYCFRWHVHLCHRSVCPGKSSRVNEILYKPASS